MNYYCEISIIDNATKKKRKCKNLFKFDILGKKCCTIHLNSFYIKYIVKIQKVFRAFNLRKKLKYFKLLPNDLQHKIIIYSRDSFYENKNSINNLKFFIKKRNK